MNEYIIKQKIKNAKIISFDIFDTLLVRPFLEPKNVFDFLSKHLQEPEFAYKRSVAEDELRIEGNYFPTYDDIYKHLPTNFNYIKEIERQFEIDTLFANPFVKKIYNYAKELDKRIIIVSDMYFDEATLKTILTKNGYDKYEKIYISAYKKKCKYDGSIFPDIVEDCNVKTSDILHIGDNKIADYISPQKFGIKAFRIKAPRDNFLQNHKFLKKFCNQNKDNLTVGIILGLIIKNMLLKKQNLNYWYNFGYFWGGPFCYGLSEFIIESMKSIGLNELICVARDGYSIEKIVNLLDKSLKTYYVYASRSINLMINLDCSTELSWTHRPSSIVRLYRDLSEEFNKRCKNIVFVNDEDYINVINSNMDILKPLSNKILEQYAHYINKFKINDSNIALFDISGGAFNSYKLLNKVLNNKKITGLYWYAIKNSEIIYKQYLKSTNNTVKNYELLEFIITAPELPIKLLDTKGDFIRINNVYETERANSYKYVSEGEIDWAQDYLNTFKYVIPLDPKILVEYLNVFCDSYTFKDVKQFSKIYHGCDEAHTQYKKLLPQKKIKFKFLEKIFSLKNKNNHKVLTILGIRISFKRIKDNG